MDKVCCLLTVDRCLLTFKKLKIVNFEKDIIEISIFAKNQNVMEIIKDEIIIYQPDDKVKIEVRLNDDMIWISQPQMVLLFQSSKANISEHIKNIFQQNELDENSTVRKIRTLQKEGNREVYRNISYYNLDVIISVGFRVNTKIGIHFRQWANNILKNNLLKGYSINQRIDYIENKFEQKLNDHDVQLGRINEQINYFVQKSIPPIQGVFIMVKFLTHIISSQD